MPCLSDVRSIGVGVTKAKVIEIVKPLKKTGEVNRALVWRIVRPDFSPLASAAVNEEADGFIAHAWVGDGVSA